jgi:hypothetical protein
VTTPRRRSVAPGSPSRNGLRRPTLDDVFLQLTGETPGENGKSPIAAEA